MDKANDTPVDARFADFQSRLAAIAEHQKRAYVMMAVHSLLGNEEDKPKPTAPWYARLKNVVVQHMAEKDISSANPKLDLNDEWDDEEVIEAEYRVLDDEEERSHNGSDYTT